jgi:hypothetical protein
LVVSGDPRARDPGAVGLDHGRKALSSTTPESATATSAPQRGTDRNELVSGPARMRRTRVLRVEGEAMASDAGDVWRDERRARAKSTRASA